MTADSPAAAESALRERVLKRAQALLARARRLTFLVQRQHQRAHVGVAPRQVDICPFSDMNRSKAARASATRGCVDDEASGRIESSAVRKAVSDALRFVSERNRSERRTADPDCDELRCGQRVDSSIAPRRAYQSVAKSDPHSAPSALRERNQATNSAPATVVVFRSEV